MCTMIATKDSQKEELACPAEPLPPLGYVMINVAQVQKVPLA